MTGASRPADVHVLGLDAANRRLMARVRTPERYRIHALLPANTVIPQPGFDLDHLLSRLRGGLAFGPVPVDAVVGFWDFPTSTILPVLRREHGLPGPSLESVLRCEHKLWSRRVQRAVLPEVTPEFRAVDPFDREAAQRLDLPFPFWLKPAKSFQSHLGFYVDDRKTLEEALETIRGGIDKLAQPFDQLLRHAELPEDLEALGGRACIAEELISRGHQCTLEGFRLDGETRSLGVIDSLNEEGSSSFDRYQYPSTLPDEVQGRMRDMSARFLEEAGFDDSPFNVEFYWNPEADALRLLEVNPRISQSHAPLFAFVDGTPNHEAMVEVALRRDPHFPHREGAWPMAAKCFLRRHEDAVVARVPDHEEIETIERDVPGTFVHTFVTEEGQRLSDLPLQEPYSYALGAVHVGARDERELLAKRDEVASRLSFDFE